MCQRTLRWLAEEDLDALESLEQACFSQPWSRESLRAELSGNPVAHYFGCFEGNDLVGYAGAWLVVDEIHVTNIATAPAYRRQGVGALLLRAMITWALANQAAFITLEVRESNQPALALYESFGFVPAGHRPHYYTHPDEAALLLTLPLPEGQKE